MNFSKEVLYWFRPIHLKAGERSSSTHFLLPNNKVSVHVKRDHKKLTLGVYGF